MLIFNAGFIPEKFPVARYFKKTLKGIHSKGVSICVNELRQIWWSNSSNPTVAVFLSTDVFLVFLNKTVEY